MLNLQKNLHKNFSCEILSCKFKELITLFNGVATPVSPIKGITGPSSAVPSCLCPLTSSNAATNSLNSSLFLRKL